MTDADLSGAIVDPGMPLPPGWQRDQESGRVSRTLAGQEGTAAAG
jgi:hypothetical protein